jgi:hypothetical protein
MLVLVRPVMVILRVVAALLSPFSRTPVAELGPVVVLVVEEER